MEIQIGMTYNLINRLGVILRRVKIVGKRRFTTTLIYLGSDGLYYSKLGFSASDTDSRLVEINTITIYL